MNSHVIYHIAANDIPFASITNKCIVLDLDQTLIATQDEVSSLKKLMILSDPNLISLRRRTYYITLEDLEKPGVGSKYDFWGVTRPHIEEFLIFCFSYFKLVIVWSAGKRLYVEAIVDHIFKDLPKPHFVFTYDDITFSEDGNVCKPLTKIINSNDILRKHMSLENTLALDDNSMTFRQNPGNGVLLPAYDPSLNIDSFSRDDPTLLQFKQWLLQPEVINSTDVTTLNKDNIFTTSLQSYKNKINTPPSYLFH